MQPQHSLESLSRTWPARTLVPTALAVCLGSLVCSGCGAPEEDPGRGNGALAGQPGAGPGVNPPLIGGDMPGDGPPIVGDDDPVDVETGEEDCDSLLEVTYRDFDQNHPDFERTFRGDVVRLQLLAPELGEDQLPVFMSSIGCPQNKAAPQECENWTPTEVTIESAATFDQWYRTVAGVNHEVEGQLALTEVPAGSGVYVYDSAAFFPLETTFGFGVTPPNNGLGQNFLFTTEIHLLFSYVKGQKFSFRGDDDLWIFVNKKIALDLGSMHGPEAGTIDFDAQAAALGISPGGTYSMDIFHAERHTDGSNFRIETNIACFTPGKPSGPK